MVWLEVLDLFTYDSSRQPYRDFLRRWPSSDPDIPARGGVGWAASASLAEPREAISTRATDIGMGVDVDVTDDHDMPVETVITLYGND